ncbi:MAG: ATP-binding protein [Pseudomonadales bacterium]
MTHTDNQEASRTSRRLPIAWAFSLLLFISTVLFGAGIAIVVTYQVDSLLRESRQAFIKQEMQGLSRELSNYVLLRNSALKDYAAFPVMTQSVMQPQANQGNIQDFMDDLLLLGDKVPLTLYDFSGAVIYATHSPPACTYKPDKTWNDPLMPGVNLSICTSPTNQQSYWHIITPINYLGQAEGFFLAELAISKVIDALALTEHARHHQLQLAKDQQVFLSLGEPVTTPTTQIDLDELGITLSYRTDDSALQKGRDTILFQLMVSGVIIWGLIVSISNRLGKHYFIEPLLRLRQFATDIADGNTIEMPDSTQKIHEISELETHFKTMAAKVIHREASLYQAKKALETVNQQLIDQQQQLVHSEKMASVGQLAAGVAHEINNPTGFVMGNLEILNEYKDSIKLLIQCYEQLEVSASAAGNDSINEALQQINTVKTEQEIDYIMEDMEALISDSLRGAERIQKIVKDLKSFSRVDDTDMKEVDLNEDVIETALRLVWNELKYKCTLHKSLSTIPLYACHPGELSQVILNLLINASDAIETKGEITLTSDYCDAEIVIQVSDTGTGINEETMLKLFDPFFTTKDIGKGTGLGLSISQGIVKKHGGSLRVNSQLGQGTTFTIRLPVTSPLSSAVM